MNHSNFQTFAQGTTIHDRYIVERTIGVGSNAMVYKCRDKKLGRRVVAVKVMFTNVEDEILTRFRREVCYTYKVLHTNVVRTFEFVDEPNLIAITLEYIDGGDLRDLMGSGQKLSLHTIVDILLQIGMGLKAIHGADIVHRDLKPENILLDKAGRIVISDFGIAWASNATSLTCQNGIIGSLSYISPEYFETGKLDQRADIYAYGVIAYELLTGKHPYEGDPLLVLMQQAKKKVVPISERLDDCPPELAQIVMKALSPIPEHRYQRISDLCSELVKFSEETGIARRGTSELAPTVERILLKEAARVPSKQVKVPVRISDRTRITAAFVLAISLIWGASVLTTPNLGLSSQQIPEVQNPPTVQLTQESPGKLEQVREEEQQLAKLKSEREQNLSMLREEEERVAKLKAEREAQLDRLKKEAEALVRVKTQLQSAQEATKAPTSLPIPRPVEAKAVETKVSRASLANPVTARSTNASAEPVDTSDQRSLVRQLPVDYVYHVKAALVYKFVDYIEWPERSAKSSRSPLVLCVIGHDPFGAAFDEIIARERQRTVKVLRFADEKPSPAMDACHLAFISNPDTTNADRLLGRLHAANVLTLSDFPGKVSIWNGVFSIWNGVRVLKR